MSNTVDNIQSVADLYKKRDKRTDRIIEAGMMSDDEWANRDRTNESAEDEIIMTIFRQYVREMEKDSKKDNLSV
jgi:hypothetical protein